MRQLVHFRVAVALAAMLFGATVAPRAFAAEDFERLVSQRPAPAWVTPTAVDASVPSNDAEASGGVTSLLDETRIRLTPRGAERYERYVDKAVSAAGVESLAEITVDIEPAYETLELHSVRVLRDGLSIDALPGAAVRLVQRESELERRMYLGTVTAYVVLRDVRVGDVVDVSYSIRGQNPVFQGRYAGEFSLGSHLPTRVLKRQVIDDRPTHVAVRALGDATEPRVSDGKELRLEWELHDLQPEPAEDGDGSFQSGPWIQLSDFRTWKDVAAWGAGLYEKPGRASPEIRALAETFRSSSSERTEQALAAVRFVQDEIRYLSIQNGTHSHEPHDATEVLEQRFGDCKDKSLLLAVLLRELGFEADVALVDTEMAGDVAELLPSPAAFDHVIVRANVEARALWIDATVSNQGGTLLTEVPANFGVALIMSPGASQLARMPVPALQQAQRDTLSEYSVRDDGSAQLRITTTYQGDEADRARDYLARTAPSDVARDSIESLTADFSGIKSAEPPRTTDDRRANRLVIEEKYAIPRFWKNDHRDLESQLIKSYLPELDADDSRQPLEFEHPVWVVDRTEITLPQDAHLDFLGSEVRSSAFFYENRARTEGRRIVLRDEYRSLANVLPASEAQRYALQRDDVPRVTTVERFRHPEAAPGPRAFDFTPVKWLLLGALLSFGGMFGAWVLRRMVQHALRSRAKGAERTLADTAPAVADTAAPTNTDATRKPKQTVDEGA